MGTTVPYLWENITGKQRKKKNVQHDLLEARIELSALSSRSLIDMNSCPASQALVVEPRCPTAPCITLDSPTAVCVAGLGLFMREMEFGKVYFYFRS